MLIERFTLRQFLTLSHKKPTYHLKYVCVHFNSFHQGSIYIGKNWQIEKIASWTAAKFEPGTSKKGQ